ncbi:MAG: TlpA family protein disulfide reductase [Dehalococcoidia bacterium]|nr:TlpA family protein disulfide reductase [Dehalococcoidia bacterium]
MTTDLPQETTSPEPTGAVPTVPPVRGGPPLILRLLPVLLALVAVTAAGGILLGQGVGATPSTGVTSPYKFTAGMPAPEFTLQSLEGKPVSLSDYRGKTVLVNFWATWCPPCRSEMPDMQRLAQDHPDDLVVLAVDLQEAPDPIASFAKQFGLTFPILLDTRGDVSQAFGVQSLPSSFFIDPQGRIASFNIGALNESAMRRRLQQVQEQIQR